MKTTDYKIFAFAKNRPFSYRKNLAESYNKVGYWTNAVTVVEVDVDEIDFEVVNIEGKVIDSGVVLLVIDGQHRIETSRVEGWGIPYYINKEIQIDDIPIIIPEAQIKKSWRPIDYIKREAEEGNQDYMMLLASITLWEDEKISVGPLSMAYALDSSAVNNQVKNGTYKYSNSGNKIIKNCMKLKPFIDKTSQTQYFIHATKTLMEDLPSLDYSKLVDLFDSRPELVDNISKLTNSLSDNRKRILRLYALTIKSQNDQRQASGELYNFVTVRSGGGCQNPSCGNIGEEVDHYVPHSKGGDTSQENLIHLCKSCNASYRDREKDFENPNKYWNLN